MCRCKCNCGASAQKKTSEGQRSFLVGFPEKPPNYKHKPINSYFKDASSSGVIDLDTYSNPVVTSDTVIAGEDVDDVFYWSNTPGEGE